MFPGSANVPGTSGVHLSLIHIYGERRKARNRNTIPPMGVGVKKRATPSTARTVSYTHLDVYKRQIQHIMDKPSLSRDHNGKCANSKEKYFSHSIDTVSYTHLDVYKRQEYDNEEYLILTKFNPNIDSDVYDVVIFLINPNIGVQGVQTR